MKNRGKSGLTAAEKIILCLLPVVAASICIGIGRINIPLSEVFSVLKGHLLGGAAAASTVERTIWNIRLPRILLALLVGAGLSASGCAYQSLFSNPLATPDTLGVASGAGFGAALALLLGMEFMGVQLVSLLFGGTAVCLTMLAGKSRQQRGMSSVVLAGIMIGSLFNALISLVKFSADTESQLPEITYWLMGTLDSAGYDSLKLGAPFILGGIGILLLLRWRMNLLPLDDDEAVAMGVNLKALRLVVVFCATAMTASCVSMCGQVGWVGLLVPHMCRMKFGNNHLALLPASILTGAAFMVVVDTLARSLTAAEMPISILTAIIGAPFFIILMRRTL
ncbi:MAG: FecCD family ABC transporter permease [Lachnospiraceae bacterium]